MKPENTPNNAPIKITPLCALVLTKFPDKEPIPAEITIQSQMVHSGESCGMRNMKNTMKQTIPVAKRAATNIVNSNFFPP